MAFKFVSRLNIQDWIKHADLNVCQKNTLTSYSLVICSLVHCQLGSGIGSCVFSKDRRSRAGPIEASACPKSGGTCFGHNFLIEGTLKGNMLVLVLCPMNVTSHRQSGDVGDLRFDGHSWRMRVRMWLVGVCGWWGWLKMFYSKTCSLYAWAEFACALVYVVPCP